jgi:hypothetical protein
MGLVHKCETNRLSYLFRQSIVMCSDSVKGFCIQICAGFRRWWTGSQNLQIHEVASWRLFFLKGFLCVLDNTAMLPPAPYQGHSYSSLWVWSGMFSWTQAHCYGSLQECICEKQLQSIMQFSSPISCFVVTKQHWFRFCERRGNYLSAVPPWSTMRMALGRRCCLQKRWWWQWKFCPV